jgi:hypothetical protein
MISKTTFSLLVILASSSIIINLSPFNHNNNAIAAKPDFVTLEQMTKQQHSTIISMTVPSTIPSNIPVDVTLQFANQKNNGENVNPLTNLAYDFRVIQNDNATYEQMGNVDVADEGGGEAIVTPTFDKGPATIVVVLNPPSTSVSNQTEATFSNETPGATDSASFDIEVS